MDSKIAEKIIDCLKEKYVTHKCQIKSNDMFCQGLNVAIEICEKKLKELTADTPHLSTEK